MCHMPPWLLPFLYCSIATVSIYQYIDKKKNKTEGNRLSSDCYSSTSIIERDQRFSRSIQMLPISMHRNEQKISRRVILSAKWLRKCSHLYFIEIVAAVYSYTFTSWINIVRVSKCETGHRFVSYLSKRLQIYCVQYSTVCF